jgi:hypothetical protein
MINNADALTHSIYEIMFKLNYTSYWVLNARNMYTDYGIINCYNQI